MDTPTTSSQETLAQTPPVTSSSPNPVPTTIEAPVTPMIQVIPPTNPPEPNRFFKRPKTFWLIILGVVIIVAVSAVLIMRVRPTRQETGNLQAPTQKSVTTDLSRYATDSDSDGYPDFIETELGLNPRESADTECNKSGCGEADLSKNTGNHNVLIILDASGSMATNNRMDVAKQAIHNYVTQASNAKIGLMIYGHKGSNSAADKAVSCASADVISPIGQVTSTSVDTYLAQVRPVGWTPMGYSLQQAATAFVGKEGQNNEIILLSDGEETCNSNPTGQASALKASSAKITINVIGFAVDTAAQTQLNMISTNGGGTFAAANSLTELDQRFNDLYQNGLKLYEQAKCKLDNVAEFRTCYNTQFDKIIEWVRARKLLLYDKKITQEEYDLLDKLSSKLYQQQKEVTTNATQNTIDDIRQKQEQLHQ